MVNELKSNIIGIWNYIYYISSVELISLPPFQN